MSEKACARTEALIGRSGLIKLAGCHVLIAGLGGVGGHVAETLARAGVGELTLIDPDTVSASNLNRQIVALRSTLGTAKVEVMQERIADINPDIQVHALNSAVSSDNARTLLQTRPVDFVADCIDSLAAKVALIAASLEHDTAVLSSMGAAGRFDPTKIRIARLNQTHSDGLAKAVRNRLKQLGIAPRLPVIFSEEVPEKREGAANSAMGTIAHLPAAFGLVMAGEILRRLLADDEPH